MTASLSPRTVQALRVSFKQINRLVLLQWQLGLGKLLNSWPRVLGRYMVIVHQGRKSGKSHCTPVNYAEVDGEIYCTAGFGRISDWYKNILAKPEIEVWLPDGWWCAVAEDVTASPNGLQLLRQVLIGSGFASPMFGINPTTISDQALQAATKDYRLVHIRRAAARTGAGGPGELAWIWPVSALLLAGLALRPRRKP